MKCSVCGKEYEENDSFIIKEICNECYNNLSESQKENIDDKISILKDKKINFSARKWLFIVLGIAIIILIIIGLAGGHWSLYIIGVGVVAGIIYSIYENLIELMAGILVVGGGLLAYYLTDKNILPWHISIIICGVIIGFLIAPLMIVIDVKNLKKKNSSNK